jgi:hypothetical protein
MPKKCIICNKDAVLCIKDSSECYCQECAEEHFADLNCLTKIEDNTSTIIKEKIKNNTEDSC